MFIRGLEKCNFRLIRHAQWTSSLREVVVGLLGWELESFKPETIII